MRFVRSLLAVSFACVVTAALSPSAASVYYFPSSNSEKLSSKPSSISLPEAELVLAHRFGSSRFHNLGEYDAQRIASLSKAESARSQLFGGNSDDAKTEVVITISGVSDVKALLPDRQPDFIIETMSSSTSVDKLPSDVIEMVFPGELDAALYSRLKFKNENTIIDTYGFDKNKPAHTQYILEKRLLDSLWYGDLHSEIGRKDNFILLRLRSLEGLLKDGDISSYDSALKQLTEYFQKLDIFDSLTIIISPPSVVGSDTRSNELKKRREIPISIANSNIGSAEMPQPMTNADGGKEKIQKPEWNGCYSSEETCSLSTNNCSKHGKCAVSNYPYHDCWTCSCSASDVKVGDKGFKKVYWTGNKCQKQDISVQFHIFLGFTVAMILAIGSAINLLFSVGYEELPGVLTAGIVSKKA